MNKSDFLIETRRKVLKYYDDTGFYPRFLYIGKQEFIALEELVSSECLHHTVGKPGGDEFDGLQVFKVDVESHFRVS